MSQSLLLKIVRESITEVFEARNTINREQLIQDYPVLQEPIASFVNIYLDDDLRGSHGSVFPAGSLLEGIIHNAKAAAFEDPRFSPLKTSEYLQAKIELSLLTPPKEISYQIIDEIKKQVTPNQDGLIISLGENHSAFLPQVWSQFNDFDSFFSRLLAEAELTLHDMGSHPKISIFQIEKQIDEPILE